MSDDRRDDTDSNETTGELRDNTIDFGDEFGEVKFADSDDSAPAISVNSTDTAQLPPFARICLRVPHFKLSLIHISEPTRPY